MAFVKPSAEVFWQALEIYLRHAYGDVALPNDVCQRITALRSSSPEALYDQPGFERDKNQPQGTICLRLGNRFYPHMKLMIERSPNGLWPLLRADTHDRHIAPPLTSPAYEPFRRLMAQNAAIAAAIESEWTEKGLPTFKKLLKDDLARRIGHGAI